MPSATAQDLPARLIDIAQASPRFMAVLRAVGAQGLRSWCVGAGAVRNLVWDHLHGYGRPSEARDVDVAYFAPDEPAGVGEQAIEQRLRQLMPELPWEVTNQAHVHRWFEAHFGHAVPPLQSLHEAVGTWPEYATAVGLYLDQAGQVQVIAPHGLEDLFNLVVRRNPTRVSLQTYRQRVAAKQYPKRWPRVTVIPA